jgi:tRNA (guanine37-N1)-methyltransferase
MKIDVLTLFPKMFEGFLSESIIKRAIEQKYLEVNLYDFRLNTPLRNNQVDDTIYGGGPGMLLRCEPIFETMDKLDTDGACVVMLTPDGEKFNQSMAVELAKEKHIVFICGHYEGFDERIRTICNKEISIGDYVLTGGELPSMCIIDAVTRLIPGVINGDSLESETFNDNLLDYPVYTKPEVYRGMKVPEILLSGDHAKIDKWREEKRMEKTQEKRPDLLK